MRRLAAHYAEQFRLAALEMGASEFPHPGWERFFWKMHRKLRRLA